MVMIGIDPGVDTGVALWDSAGQEWINIVTSDFWEVYHDVRGLKYKKMLVIIEDPSKNKPVFNRGKINRKKAKKMQKIAQNVGMNKREATLLIEGFKRAGIPVMAIRPQSKKWSKDFFEKITGYSGRTSQHGRDAAKLVYGRPPMPEGQYQLLRKEVA